MNKKGQYFFFQSLSLLSFTIAPCGYVQYCLLSYYASLLPPYTPALPLYYYFLLMSFDLLTSYFLPEYNLETGFNTYKYSSWLSPAVIRS